MIKNLPHDENEFHKSGKSKEILNTSGDSKKGYVLEVVSKYLDEIKEKTIFFHFVLRIKLVFKIFLVII